MNWVVFATQLFMLDNCVVDQTCLKVLPTETWDLLLLCFKKN